MGRTRYVLTIDSPCQQDWNSMTQNETGKFCDHCAHTVVDFTRLTDHEIIQVLEKNSGRLCGRLSQKQLNRIMESRNPERHSRLYQILAGLLFIGTTENTLASETLVSSTASIEMRSENENSFDSDQSGKQDEPFTDSLKNVVKGTVLDAEFGETMPFVYVSIKGTEIRSKSDANGEFSLTIPENLIADSIILVISFPDYTPGEFTIPRNKLPLKRTFSIKSEMPWLGEIVPYKKKWWQRKRS